MTPLTRLRVALALFLLALGLPTVALIYQAYQRLQWESFHQHQGLAKEFAARVDQRLRELVMAEDRRPFTEYSYFKLVTPRNGAVLQRSALAELPPYAAVPGLIGHFQVDSKGLLSVPYLPPTGSDDAVAGLSATQQNQGLELAARLRAILTANRLIAAREAERPRAGAPPQTEYMARGTVELDSSVDKRASAPAPFDSLNAVTDGAARSAPSTSSLGRVADLKLEQRFQGAPVMAEAASPRETGQAAPKARRALRKESSALPALRDTAAAATSADARARILTFESEVDSFDSSLLASGELVLFRNVWRDGQRYVQGLLLDREHFLAELIGAPFNLSPLASSSSLLVARHGEVLMRKTGATSRDYDAAPTLRGTLLYQSRLAAPFSDLELIFSVTRLPAGAGAPVIAWLSALLALVLCGGLWLAYRLGARQLALARQQQEFIAAVSHELKTPLTSIRMYGEMLREGWAPEEKRQTYYSFIHDEAERLTRLINNVLNLARMTRNELSVDMRDITVAQLLERVRPTLDSVVAHAARRYTLECQAQASTAVVRVDVDCFTQIILNLLDNALKFSSGEQALELTVRTVGATHIDFALRDFGPGITKEQIKRIFALFYRGENALTRATAGTGIGLALVKRLVEVMGGEVRVENREPGAEFYVRLPRSGA